MENSSIGSIQEESISKLKNGRKLKKLKHWLKKDYQQMVNFLINFKLLALCLLHSKLKKDLKELFTTIELTSLISLENKLRSNQHQNQQTLFGRIDNMNLSIDSSSQSLFGSLSSSCSVSQLLSFTNSHLLATDPNSCSLLLIAQKLPNHGLQCKQNPVLQIFGKLPLLENMKLMHHSTKTQNQLILAQLFSAIAKLQKISLLLPNSHWTKTLPHRSMVKP